MEFAIMAQSAHDAAVIARDMPRVKHHMKEAITSISELTYDEYRELKAECDANPYFKCTSSQEQRSFMDQLLPFIKPMPEKEIKREGKRNSAAFRRSKEREYLESMSSDIQMFWAYGQQLFVLEY